LHIVPSMPPAPQDLLDPSIAQGVEGFAVPEMTLEVVEMIQSMGSSIFAATELSDAVERIDHLVPGDPDVALRVHRRAGADGLRPALYSMHGGGYMIGSYDMDDAMFDDRCQALDIVGVSVEYRLAPTTPYPGPLEDCYRGLKWTYDHAEELGIDRDRLGVTGVSAGGGLAAALALLARDRGEIPIAFQLLDCPMIDDRQATHSSRLAGLPVWSRESNEFGWRSYLGELYGSSEVPYTAAPARADDLTGLPPAFISVGSVDGFLDEDVDFALRLNRAGVPCELHVYPGACHGYQMVAGSPIVARSRADIIDWLARQTR
jgi:acetyl esterase/lipase